MGDVPKVPKHVKNKSTYFCARADCGVKENIPGTLYLITIEIMHSKFSILRSIFLILGKHGHLSKYFIHKHRKVTPQFILNRPAPSTPLLTIWRCSNLLLFPDSDFSILKHFRSGLQIQIVGEKGGGAVEIE